MRQFGLEQIEQHVPGGIGEQFFREIARAQPPRANDRADGFRPRFPAHVGGRRFDARRELGLRTGRKPRKRRCDPADFLAQLAQPRGVLVRRDVGQRAGPRRDGSRHRQCRRALGIVGIDEQLRPRCRQIIVATGSISSAEAETIAA